MNPLYRPGVGRTSVFVALVAAATLLPGCEAIKTIFEAGVWVGIVAVVLVLGVIGGIVALARR
jgi:hypothetical protein